MVIVVCRQRRYRCVWMRAHFPDWQSSGSASLADKQRAARVFEWCAACAEEDRCASRMVLKRGMGIRTTNGRETRVFKGAIQSYTPTFTLFLIDSSKGIISPGTEDLARLYYNSSRVTGVCTADGGLGQHWDKGVFGFFLDKKFGRREIGQS